MHKFAARPTWSSDKTGDRMIDRRTLLVSSLSMIASPLVADAQTPARVFRIGVLGGSTPTSAEARHVWAAFFEGLRELGYVEGQNVVIEGRFYEDSIDRLPSLAAELARLPVDVIVTVRPRRLRPPSGQRQRSRSSRRITLIQSAVGL